MIEKLSSSLDVKGEEPNIQCAIELSETESLEEIREIAEGLNAEKKIAHDCIKVMYEIGYRKPELISAYVDSFLELLTKKDNRMIWGAMCALSTIASLVPDRIFEKIDIVIEAYKNGSVITRDCSISVFAELAKSSPEFSRKVLPLLYTHLKSCRPKEVPQHAERASVCFADENAEDFEKILLSRYNDLSASQKKRVDKLLTKLRAH